MNFAEIEPRERGEEVKVGGGGTQNPDCLSRVVEGGVEGCHQPS